jgi:hypothetical protein
LLAVCFSNIEVANFLIAQGADTRCLSECLPNSKTTLLYHTLISEIFSINEKIFNFLCTPQANVNPNIASFEYYTPLTDVAQYISHVRFIKPLLNIGADPSWPRAHLFARHAHNRVFFEEIKTFEPEKHVNKLNNIHEKKLSLEYFQTEILLREYTHVLGLDKSKCSALGKFLKKEGGYSFENYCLLDNILTKYSKTQSLEMQKYFGEIQTALNLAICFLKFDGTATHQHLIDHHAQGKPIVLPIVWGGGEEAHAFAIIVWNDLVTLCNRGYKKKLENAISVFVMPSPGKLTKELLQTILPENGVPSAKQVLEGIHAWLDTTKPILTFPSQDQKHDTCSFVNIKSSIQPFLCFMILLALKKIDLSLFNSTFLMTLTQNGESIDPDLTNAKQIAKTNYKTFTHHMRDQKVLELCNTYTHCADPDLQMVYTKLFEELIEKYLQSSKDVIKEFEMDRAKMILKFVQKNDSGSIVDTLKYHSNSNHFSSYRKEFYTSELATALLAWLPVYEERQLKLNEAIKVGKLDLAQSLLKEGANINGFYGKTAFTPQESPLWIAIQTENLDTFKWVLSKGADISMRFFRNTLLRHIVKERKWNILQRLLEEKIYFPLNFWDEPFNSTHSILEQVKRRHKDIIPLIEQQRESLEKPIEIKEIENSTVNIHTRELTKVEQYYANSTKSLTTIQPAILTVAPIQNPAPSFSFMAKNKSLLEIVKKLQSINHENKQNIAGIKTSIISNELTALEQSLQLKNANPILISKRLKNFIAQYNHKSIEIPQELCVALEPLTHIPFKPSC